MVEKARKNKWRVFIGCVNLTHYFAKQLQNNHFHHAGIKQSQRQNRRGRQLQRFKARSE